jgi:hypothetical protein
MRTTRTQITFSFSRWACPRAVYDAGLLEALQDEIRQMTLGEKVAEVEALREHGGDRTSAYFQPDNDKVEKYGTSSRYRIGLAAAGRSVYKPNTPDL